MTNNDKKAWSFVWAALIISYLIIAIFLIVWSIVVDKTIAEIF